MIYLMAYDTIQTIILIAMVLATLNIFMLAAAGLFYKQVPYTEQPKFRKIAVLIPGYREDEVIIETVMDALKQDYPVYLYDVVVIADSLAANVIGKLKEMPVKVIEVCYEQSTKTKALIKALEVLGDDYQVAVILDADNLMAKDFLYKVNAAFERNIIAVQGHRIAKNLDTPFAMMDALSEEINNHIFRKGLSILGLSSSLTGSGMAFQYDTFKSLMTGITAVGGFDKELELELHKREIKIAYLDDAYVYDEKIQEAENFRNQRLRWLSAQYHYFRKDIWPSIKLLISKRNIDYFYKTVLFAQPPRIVLIGSIFLMGTVFLLVNQLIGDYWLMNRIWILAAILCSSVFVFSIPKSFYTLKMLKALIVLPRIFFIMAVSIMKLKGVNKNFLHTKHGLVVARSQSQSLPVN
jgi:cellulose synthase/poly-beta-1,6-N-acetylglucosamine synthase-like glycosyltransferase